jgi:hypothetical protein
VKILGTYIAARSLEESISAVKADIMKPLVKNGLIKQHQMDKKLDAIQEQTKPRSVLTTQFSKLRTLEDEPLRGKLRQIKEQNAIILNLQSIECERYGKKINQIRANQ